MAPKGYRLGLLEASSVTDSIIAQQYWVARTEPRLLSISTISGMSYSP
jgi:hypothetical protein